MNRSPAASTATPKGSSSSAAVAGPLFAAVTRGTVAGDRDDVAGRCFTTSRMALFPVVDDELIARGVDGDALRVVNLRGGGGPVVAAVAAAIVAGSSDDRARELGAKSAVPL